ncbi:putative Rho guanyl nucleotide exchange factor [Aspergillus clavatus NRRL 1]|uniref:CNH domain protein n=1 Tax=Aspergillus clavatus (strain ATCC 1007 / CBS 513.65 / DSM 816 / NCTC 3887 / NRRL 1 / QM 1276 / 107) TaxID=344612 RepID=A1CA75_ASPCL|nr:CNH domain protein [Aspergillus clavatus NRRL 1]EAW12643.1 CNH domain protein [Aspergillus clavatus NRRL 1]
MDYFRITNIWYENIGGKSGAKVRFEKLDLSKKSWWAAKSSPDPVPFHQRPEIQLEVKSCEGCHLSSPHIYNKGWMCLQPSCSDFWKIDGIEPPVDLTFHSNFLQSRNPPAPEIIPHHDLVPNLLPTLEEEGGGVSYARIAWKGIVCPKCRKCISRKHWCGWKCTDVLIMSTSVGARTSCTFEKMLPMQPVSLRSVIDDFGLGPNRRACHFDPRYAIPEIDDQTILPYRKLTYKIPGVGCITHFVSTRTINSRPNGPNDLFRQLQVADFGLRRYPLQQSVVAGTLTAHFAVNYGMPYKYIVSVDSKSFGEAPGEVLRAMGRLTWATERAVAGSGDTFLPPNELLMLGYFEEMRIGYHDDGESSLGPTIATLSLGAKSTMSIRMKYKYYNGISKTKTLLKEDPALAGSRMEAERRSLKTQFASGEIDQATYDRLRRQTLQKGRCSEAPVYIKMELNHGDLVVMHGEDLQRYYENGQSPYYGQSNNSTPPSTQPSSSTSRYDTYTSQQQQNNNHQLRRIPSYIAGDDAGLFGGSSTSNARTVNGSTRYNGQAGGYGGEEGQGAYSLANSGYDDNSDPRYAQIPSGGPPPPLPLRDRALSQSNYAYQYSSIASPTQAAYNPQQYAVPSTPSQQQFAYNTLAYTASSNTVGGHQPYNPAAYQSASVGGYGSPTVQRQPSMANLYAQPPPTPQTYTSQQSLPPPPPPRGPDHPYGSRTSGPYGSASPAAQYGFSAQSSVYSVASPLNPNAPYPPASSLTATSLTSATSRSYSHGAQALGYVPQSPRRSEAMMTPYPGDQPPEPPAHSAPTEDIYGKRLSLTRPGSGRSLPTPPIQSNQGQVSPRRTDTLNRHPQARPLPGPPVDTDGESPLGTNGTGRMGSLDGRSEPPSAGYDYFGRQGDAIVDRHSSGDSRYDSKPLHIDTQTTNQEAQEPSRPFSATSSMRLSPDERHTHTNGNIATGTGQYVNYDAYSDDSDAEAAAGLAMLQMADEEDRMQAERVRTQRERVHTRRETNASIISAYGSHSSVHAPSPRDSRPDGMQHAPDGTSDGAHYGGYRYDDERDGYAEQYGDQNTNQGRIVAPSGSRRSSDLSAEDRGEYSDSYDYYSMAHAQAQQYDDYASEARVDAGGTGGLSEPGAYERRMSFDYGDEAEGPLGYPEEGPHSDSEGSDAGGVPGDLFFHPGMRPLPPAPVEPANNTDLIPHLIPAGTYRHLESDGLPDRTQSTSANFHVSTDSYASTASTPTSQVPRSTSLSSHPIGPRADPPIRSKTDADRAKYKQQLEAIRQQQQGGGAFKFDPSEQGPAMTLDLPTIPAGRRKKFNPTKLSSEQFRKCTEPWALSSILVWIRDLCEDETDLRRSAILEAIVALFTHKVPTMNIADAETLAARVFDNMLEQEALVWDEEWVKFGSGTLSGVLFQITGTGCYSPVLHEQEAEVSGRCYSHHCMRTLKKVNLKTQKMAPQKKAEDWVTFYKVPKEVWEAHPKKEIDRQNNLHEIVTTEDAFIGQLDVLRELYRDQLAGMQPSIIPPKRLNKFLTDVFGKVDAVKKVNEEYLLAQLKYRQKEQGPFIVGFSDIFREWIRKAKTVYIDYAATFPHANYLVRKETERNALFRQFLNQAREHKMSNRLSWDTYLKSPITRIQRYTLLLSTVHKNMPKDSEEKANLAQAIEEIKVVALECDNKVGETSKKVDLMELSAKLQLRPEMKKEVELNLQHLGREIVYRGDLQRPGARMRFLVDTHAILFDHYLVLAKLSTTRDPSKAVKYESYDVSKLPIPMDLLVLESTNDDPVVKSSVRGVSSVAPPQAVSRSTGTAPLIHTNSGNSSNSASASSGKTLVPSTVLETSKDDKILYPFKVKHLGKNGTFTLYAFSAQNRQEWCEKIIEAKTKHAAALFAQNAEPFRLRVLADTAFANSDHSASSKRTVTIKGTPLDRAIREVEERYSVSNKRPVPVCRTSVHCATVFQQPVGRMMCAVGTDFGVYISEYNNPRGWVRAIPVIRVTQIAVFEEFNLFLLIADRSLVAYHLDVVCPASGMNSQTTKDSARRAPQKLSGNREVGFFAAGHMKDRTLVMYKKRDGLSSTFKVLEPVLQKSATSRSRLFQSRRSQTEFFREYDEFYIPAESYGINMFHSSLAIATQRGIEVLTLDKKQTWSVPDFRSEAPEAQAQLSSIAHRISSLRPLGMFRLSDSEFLVAYTDCAVYVNKHGDVSRSVILEFVGRAHSACLYGKFLILFNEDFVEVRNAMNGRLRQVIPGHGVVCLDDGSTLPGSGANAVPTNAGTAANLASGLANGVALASSGHTVKICMQHPEYERSQLVLELLENEGQKD